MAFVAGKGARILLDKYHVSPFLQTASFSLTKDALETTTFQDGSRDYIEGLKNGTANLGGFFDGADDALDEALNAIFSSSATEPVSIFPGNDSTVGNPGYVTDGWNGSYEIGASFDGVVTAAATIQASSDGTSGRPGSWQRALTLVPFAAYATTQTFTAIDHGASSANGGAATIHATAHTGTTTTVIVEHDTVPGFTAPVTLATFTVTAATASRVFVSGTVNRYVRARISGIGTSTTMHVNFARF
jgi:predicted secreted protein